MPLRESVHSKHHYEYVKNIGNRRSLQREVRDARLQQNAFEAKVQQHGSQMPANGMLRLISCVKGTVTAGYLRLIHTVSSFNYSSRQDMRLDVSGPSYIFGVGW